MKSGELDLLSDVSYTNERAGDMLFSSFSMGSETYYLFVNALDPDISMHNLASLNGKKIGVNKNSIQEQLFRGWLSANGLNAQIIELTDPEAISIQRVEAGELDGLITLDSFEDASHHSCVPLIKIGQSDFFFAINKNRPDLQFELNEAMNKIHDENRFFNTQM